MSDTAFSEPTQSPTSRSFFSYWSPERSVLSHLLDEHPRAINPEELLLEIGFGEKAVMRAVENLVAAHFVIREGGALIPAPAVVSFDKEPAVTEF